MAQTVIGIFEQGIDAQTAVQKLRSLNIDSNNIDISDQTRSSTAGTDNDRSSSFFGSLFSDNDDARKHADVARRGWVVTVHSQSREEAEKAAELLDECGAIDVDEKSSQSGTSQTMQAGATGVAGANLHNSTQTNMPPQGRTNDTTDNTSMPIMEERLQVEKREVERSAARLRSRIVERPVEENLRLREEHVNIERNKVDRPATDRDFQNFKEGEIEITERAEIPVVNKEARVTEEIKINKTSDVHEETIRDTVRKTEVDIERTNENDNLREDRDRRDIDPTR